MPYYPTRKLTVFALDPDIPLDRQRVRLVVAGASSGERLRLDKRDLGPAIANPLILPGPGAHRLELVDAAGRIVDSSLFTMR